MTQITGNYALRLIDTDPDNAVNGELATVYARPLNQALLTLFDAGLIDGVGSTEDRPGSSADIPVGYTYINTDGGAGVDWTLETFTVAGTWAVGTTPWAAKDTQAGQRLTTLEGRADDAAETAYVDQQIADVYTAMSNAVRVTSGIFDPARIPASVKAAPIISAGAIADLTSEQQDAIGVGSVVVASTGDKAGVTFYYTGAGDKTLEASYVEGADSTPAISQIVGLQAELDDLNNRLHTQTGSVNPEWYGAKGDAVSGADGAITASATTYSSASASFVDGDAGKAIIIAGAGAAGASLSTTIASVTSATEIELSLAASTTVSGADYTYGTDNTDAIQAAINASDDIILGVGKYLHGPLVIANDNVSFEGSSRATTKLVFMQDAGNSLQIGTTPADLLDNINVSNLWFAQAKGVERTSGSCIHAYNIRQSALEKFYISDSYDGLTIEGSNRSEVTDVWFRRENGRTVQCRYGVNILYNTTSSIGASNLKLTRVDGVNSDEMEEFIRINCADWVQVNSSHFNKADTPVHIVKENMIVDLQFNDCYLDSAQSRHVRVTGSDTEPFTGLKFDNVYFRDLVSGGGTRNVSFEQTAVIEDVAFDNCKFSKSISHAIFMSDENVTHLSLDHCYFSESGSAGTAPVIASKAKHTSLSNCAFNDTQGTYDVSVTRTSLSGSLRVQGSNFDESGAVTDTLFHSNIETVIISYNVGLADERAPKLENSGATNVTADSSGLAIIPHGLGGTPSFATVDLYNSTDERANVVSVDGTNITAYIYDESTNTAKASVARNFRWYARV